MEVIAVGDATRSWRLAVKELRLPARRNSWDYASTKAIEVEP